MYRTFVPKALRPEIALVSHAIGTYLLLRIFSFYCTILSCHSTAFLTEKYALVFLIVLVFQFYNSRCRYFQLNGSCPLQKFFLIKAIITFQLYKIISKEYCSEVVSAYTRKDNKITFYLKTSVHDWPCIIFEQSIDLYCNLFQIFRPGSFSFLCLYRLLL